MPVEEIVTAVTVPEPIERPSAKGMEKHMAICSMLNVRLAGYTSVHSTPLKLIKSFFYKVFL